MKSRCRCKMMMSKWRRGFLIMTSGCSNAPTAIIRPAPSTSVGRPVDIAIPSPPLLPPRSSPPPSPSSPPPTYLLHQNSPIPKKPDITISDLQSIDEPISNKKRESRLCKPTNLQVDRLQLLRVSRPHSPPPKRRASVEQSNATSSRLCVNGEC